jgi:hypothetical protein
LDRANFGRSRVKSIEFLGQWLLPLFLGHSITRSIAGRLLFLIFIKCFDGPPWQGCGARLLKV